MEGVEFDEDKSYRSIPRQVPIPEKGIEGWIYRKFPGKYSFKKNLLIIIVLVIFFLAFIFFVLGFKNVNDDQNSKFNTRIKNTILK